MGLPELDNATLFFHSDDVNGLGLQCEASQVQVSKDINVPTYVFVGNGMPTTSLICTPTTDAQWIELVPIPVTHRPVVPMIFLFICYSLHKLEPLILDLCPLLRQYTV